MALDLYAVQPKASLSHMGPQERTVNGCGTKERRKLGHRGAPLHMCL